MMEDVSMQCDIYDMDQMSEEEILACLVADTEPKFTVPSKKAKLKEGLLQIMDDEKDCLDKYLKENHQLQQASLRLEQENDRLAHKLITSKVALRRALDKTEDRVDELSKEVQRVRHRLQATEEEKRGKEEEAQMLKEVFRRELEKAEQEARRSSVIIADYKQICSQLTNRLERQEAAHREQMDSFKAAAMACPRCQHLTESAGPPTAAQDSEDREVKCNKDRPQQVEQKRDTQEEEESLKAQLRELEQDLAQTKLKMVEARCKIQELEHEKGILANDLQEAKNSWISKAFTSLRTSSGPGLHSMSIHRDGVPSLGLNLHGGSISGWSGKKFSWPHKENRGNVS
ncbi:rab GTPase-activating protein 1-like [Takifugu rubripes]|uniref:RAB GTPase activating protein 1-like 2 n=1 Tax=Takifugu rubripes TaxID=31033 RepID=A0A3B5K4Q8_TAKRU|nr:rab GTPase-activating protein 1-like [Takifugu rubripes]|eukprot:XP_003962821.1 PREDICTED: rab GTPase-activating protein 1-like, isoform 10 [Takifugu rubripes]